MIAPTSGDRIKRIASEAEGFIYCVSSMGVTGVRQEVGSCVSGMVKLVREARDIPCAIGFGISAPEQAAAMAGFADGVIVGSAIVKIVGQYGKDCIPYVADYVRRMKKALTC
jgi:tryptophan synthase alpha chain